MTKTHEDMMNRLGTLIGDGIEFSGDTWRKLSKHIVYVAGTEEEVWYVGRSNNGLARCASKGHHWLGFPMVFDNLDYLKVYPCPSEQASIEAERLLIHLLKPQLNSRGEHLALDLPRLMGLNAGTVANNYKRRRKDV